MTWLERLMGVQQERIGPGRLVLVVGPSGAGKDTLIRAAQDACRGDRDIVFPRRVVTRAGSAAEDHDTLSPEAFAQAHAQGSFALAWSAHGLDYGIPAAIDAELRAGRTVVCNVSRAIVPAARARYAHPTLVLVTAPHEVLVQRLAERGRASDGDLDARIRRSASLDRELAPDFIIRNTDTVSRGADLMLQAVRGHNAMVWL